MESVTRRSCELRRGLVPHKRTGSLYNFCLSLSLRGVPSLGNPIFPVVDPLGAPKLKTVPQLPGDKKKKSKGTSFFLYRTLLGMIGF